MTNGNDSAMPVVAANGLGHISGGLTKRELFAAMAMQGMLSKNILHKGTIAEWAVKQADAFINELNKQP